MANLQSFVPMWLRDRDNADKPWGLKLPDGREIPVSDLVSGGGKVVRTRAAGRISGGTTPVAGQTNNYTYHIKEAAEAPFFAARIKVHGRDAAASVGWKAAAAVSASASQASAALMFDPTVDGSTFVTSLASSGNPNGWRGVTWAGSATTDVSAGSLMLPGETPWSDYFPVTSVPRVDGGTRPLLMLRIYHDGTSQPFTLISGAFGTGQWNGQTGKDYYREFQVGVTVGADAVASLTTKPGSLAGSGPWVSIEYLYSVPRARSVLGIGDSIMESNGTQLPGNVFGAWGMRGCARASTVDKPISWMNCGYSSQTSATYFAAGLAAISSLDPTDVLYAAGSPNDGSPEKFLSDSAMGRVMQIADVCRNQRRQLFLATMVPNENWNVAEDNERKRYNTLIRNLCASGVATLVDYGAAVGNGASPELFLPGFKFDNVHPNDAAMDVGGNLLRDALLNTW